MTKVKLKPISGRRHQLRLHTWHIGHPIVGDMTYANDNETFRMMLHARYLQLPFSATSVLTLETPDPFVEIVSEIQ